MATKTKRTPAAKKTANRPAAKKSNGRASSKKSAPKQKASKDGSLLEEFFINSLKDIYWAEKALTKALPKMVKNATSKELKKAFTDHLEETKKQIGRLEEVFESLGQKAQAKKCEAMQGLIEESEEIISETKDDSSTRDAALIIAAQKVEHYEIATYGGLIQLAKTMNKPAIAKTLVATLNEEKKADELLTKVAEASINEDASEEPAEKSGGLKETILDIFKK
jgi:ferritin-like metal-binding protein YciE